MGKNTNQRKPNDSNKFLGVDDFAVPDKNFESKKSNEEESDIPYKIKNFEDIEHKIMARLEYLSAKIEEESMRLHVLTSQNMKIIEAFEESNKELAIALLTQISSSDKNKDVEKNKISVEHTVESESNPLLTKQEVSSEAPISISFSHDNNSSDEENTTHIKNPNSYVKKSGSSAIKRLFIFFGVLLAFIYAFGYIVNISFKSKNSIFGNNSTLLDKDKNSSLKEQNKTTKTVTITKLPDDIKKLPKDAIKAIGDL